jgi:hypothetical protein
MIESAMIGVITCVTEESYFRVCASSAVIKFVVDDECSNTCQKELCKLQ